ncbi:MAG: ATPase, T2SS/T4P/T4SS family, partial [Rhodobacteraceae bacterium]|nr:ATPase, T2SS/T4P/T4SS family [Paracoccaceae bacterium]
MTAERAVVGMDGSEVLPDFAPERVGALITAPGGVLELPVEQRGLMAIFQSGQAVVAKGSRWSVDVKAVLDRAGQAGQEIMAIHEIDSDRIEAIYQAVPTGMRDGDGEPSQIERQRDLRRIIAMAAEKRASDIHVHVHASYCEVRIRVHGRLRHLTNRMSHEGLSLINAAFAVAVDQGSETGTTSYMKGALGKASGLLPSDVEIIRLQYTPTSGHRASLVMRLKYSFGSDGDDIGQLGYLPDQIRDIGIMRRRTSGMYLLAGKVSSGKTTTLQRILNAMIREKQFEISAYSIEEPVELSIAGAVHVAVAPRSDQTRGEAFVEAIKSTLRSDPNVVVLGELRDRILAGYAIELAMTGHALWTTIHSGSALGILDRLHDLGVDTWKLCEPSVIRGLMYQRLIGVICPRCRITYHAAVNEGRLSPDLAGEVIALMETGDRHLYIRGEGCSRCTRG